MSTFRTSPFPTSEKFSTASLVTRLTNDVNNMQMTLMMGMRLLVRAPVMLVAALVLSIRLSRQLSNVIFSGPFRCCWCSSP